jgi:RNA polymerase sigma-32 factor
MAETQEVDERKELLSVALGELPDREREIIIARRLQDDPATLEELSHKFGISRERVRQIEVRAFDRLQKSMKNALRDKRAAMVDGRDED